MKYILKYVIIAITCMMVSTNLTFSEPPCGSNVNCPDKPYRYTYCNPANGQIVYRCAKNPYSWEPTLTLLKAPIPLCLEFVNKPGQPTEFHVPKQTGGSIKVFDIDLITDDMERAEYAWSCLCGKQDDPCECFIKVFFASKSKNYPGNPRTGPASTWVTIKNPQSDCEVYCKGTGDDELRIVLNNTSAWTDKMHGYNLRPFLNQEYFDNDPNLLDNMKFGYFSQNLTDILIHELGNNYGLADQSDNGETYCDPPYDKGKMWGKYTTPNESSTGLSTDDKCMFMKIYCPVLVPVEERIVKKETEVYNYPNPIEDFTRLIFSVPQKGANVKIVVYDQLGREVISPVEQFYSGGDYDEQIDLSGLSSGLYYYTVQIGNETKTGKMVIGK